MQGLSLLSFSGLVWGFLCVLPRVLMDCPPPQGCGLGPPPPRAVPSQEEDGGVGCSDLGMVFPRLGPDGMRFGREGLSDSTLIPSWLLQGKYSKRKGRFKRSDGSTSSDTTSNSFVRQVMGRLG